MNKRRFLTWLGGLLAMPITIFGKNKHLGDSQKYSGHAGYCTIYASLINGRPHDGICNCGWGWDRVRTILAGDVLRMPGEIYSAELIEALQAKRDLKYKVGDIILWRDGPIENKRMRLSFVNSVQSDGSVMVDSQRGGKIGHQYDAEIVGHIENLHERFQCEQFTLWKKSSSDYAR